MTRALVSMLALLLAGCHPPAPAPGAPVAPPQPPAPVQPTSEPPTPIDTPTQPPALAVGEREPGIAPPGVGANQTACEQSCAEVHDCAVIDRAYTPAAAAAIELGCLGACLHVGPPPTTDLFGCARPTAIEPATCTPFLTCLGPEWPAPPETEPPNPLPTIDDNIDGCRRTCEALAICFAPTPPNAVEQCVNECRKALTPEQERGFGACADATCDQMFTCIQSTPGATTGP